MALSADEFVRQLVASAPDAKPTVHEHHRDYEGELLLHLLVADLRRLAIAWFAEGRREALEGLLLGVSRGLSDGDDYVVNAVAVSFVEDTGWWDPRMQPFIAGWPAALQSEAAEQRANR